MNTTLRKFLLLDILLMILVAMMLSAALPASAQIAGLYAIVNTTAPTNGTGASAVLPASSTNQIYGFVLTNGVWNGVITTNQIGNPGSPTNLVQSIANYDYVGFTWSFSTGSNATVNIFKTFDNGNTYETTPTFSFSSPASVSAAYATNVVLDVHGCTGLGFQFKNASTLAVSNNLVELNLKSAQIFVLAPGNYGKTPGTPIVVPNFPQ